MRDQKDRITIAGYFGPAAPYQGRTGENDIYVSEGTIKDTVYQKIQDLGIDLITYSVSNFDSVDETECSILEQLEYCDKYHLSMLVHNPNLLESMEDERQWKKRRRSYEKFASFAGVFIADEPETDVYFDLDTVRRIYPNHVKKKVMKDYIHASRRLNESQGCIGYINLLPYKSIYGTQTQFRMYLEEYCHDMGGKILSFDYYPFYDGSTNEYFLNLDMVRAVAEKYDMPFWSHVQAGDNFNDNAIALSTCNNCPTQAQMNWNVHTSLAFGAKGIQYFPLLQPYHFALATDGKLDAERNGLIGICENPTKWYAYARKINQFIKKIEAILSKAKNEGVIVCGNAREDVYGCECIRNTYQSVRKLSSSNLAGSLAGCFSYEGKTVLYLVNHDVKEEADLTIDLAQSHLWQIIRQDKEEEVTGNTFCLRMAAGEAVLILLNNRV